ncbi:MAG: Ig-like domain-containing protein [Calditrichaeota bacterium]|nr:Ig-like domain-containing protein [Calditrichota bacterium]
MTDFSRTGIHVAVFCILSALALVLNCGRDNKLVGPGQTARIQIQLDFKERDAASHGKSVSDLKRFKSQNIDEVTVSVVNVTSREVIVREQALNIVDTAQGRFAEGEVSIPVTDQVEVFNIIVFAADTQALFFFVGSDDVALQAGTTQANAIVITMLPAVSFALLGSVQASSTFGESGFGPGRGIDLDTRTSWLSAGSDADPNGSRFVWTGIVERLFGTMGIVNNSRHALEQYRSGFGFETVRFRVYSGPNATGEMLFEQIVPYPKTSNDPVVRVSPLVFGRSVELVLQGHENPTGGGFSELLIVDPSLGGDIPVLQSIALTPINPLQTGQAVQLTAIGTLSNGATFDVTSQAVWSSSNSAVASVDDTGEVTGVATGTATITASFVGVVGQTTVTVTDASLVSIAISPQDATIEVGKTLQLIATGNFSDGSSSDLTAQANWTSSDSQVATIEASTGLATGNAPGSTTITAELNGVTGRTGLNVSAATIASLVVTPADTTIAAGESVQYKATATFSDGSSSDVTTQANWTSSDSQVATIGATTGLAVANAPGNTTVTAAIGEVQGQVSLTVAAATLVSVTVTPENPTIVAGTEQEFNAVGAFSDETQRDVTDQVTWSSGNTTVAGITSGGVATGLQPGVTTIAAELNGISGQTLLTVTAAEIVSIEVMPQDASVPAGLTVQYSATATLSDGSPQDITTDADWTSDNTQVADVSNAGLATGLSPGTAKITAEKDGISAGTTLTVGQPELVSITVTPANPTILVDQTMQFTATGTFTDDSEDDLTKDAAWTSSDSKVALIDQNGLATGNSAGTTVIAATFGGVSGSTTLTVNNSNPARISNLQPTVIQINDSTFCDVFGGPAGTLYQFDFDYDDPDGDVVDGSVVHVSFQFLPSGSTGSFDVTSPIIGGGGFKGGIQFFVCFVFSDQTSTDVTVEMTDAGGQRSNAITVNVPKPNGANLAFREGDERLTRARAAECTGR